MARIARDVIGPKLTQVPDGDDPNVIVPFKVEDDDIELTTSGTDLELPMNNPVSKGLDIPREKQQSMLTPMDALRYAECAEVLMGRGVLMVGEMARILGINNRFARDLIAQVKERWAASATPGLVNIRREQLYLEADRVKEHCWAAIQNTTNANMQLRFMQLILAAGQRQSHLMGAEKMHVAVESTVAEHKKAEDFERDFTAAPDMAPADVAALGDIIARALSDRSKN